MSNQHTRWPADASVRITSRWRIKTGNEQCVPGERPLRPETTALLVGAYMQPNEVTLFINPAIGWQGTYQELIEYWDAVPDETPLTF